jgi:hypothetical protein
MALKPIGILHERPRQQFSGGNFGGNSVDIARLGRIGVAAPVQPPNLGTYDLGEGGWRDVGDGHGFDGAGQSRWVR